MPRHNVSRRHRTHLIKVLRPECLVAVVEFFLELLLARAELEDGAVRGDEAGEPLHRRDRVRSGCKRRRREASSRVVLGGLRDWERLLHALINNPRHLVATSGHLLPALTEPKSVSVSVFLF